VRFRGKRRPLNAGERSQRERYYQLGNTPVTGLQLPLARSAGLSFVLSTTAIHGENHAKLLFHNLTLFHWLFFQAGERLICRVTGPRRFPLPNHVTGVEIFFEREERDFFNITRKFTLNPKRIASLSPRVARLASPARTELPWVTRPKPAQL